MGINFLDSDKSEYSIDEEDTIDNGPTQVSGIKEDLDNKDLITKLLEQKQVLIDRLERLDAVIILLKQNPNYSKIHELLNTQI